MQEMQVLIPESGRSPRVGNGNLLQYSCLDNPMDRGAWWDTAQRSQRVGHNWDWARMQRERSDTSGLPPLTLWYVHSLGFLPLVQKYVPFAKLYTLTWYTNWTFNLSINVPSQKYRWVGIFSIYSQASWLLAWFSFIFIFCWPLLSLTWLKRKVCL